MNAFLVEFYLARSTATTAAALAARVQDAVATVGREGAAVRLREFVLEPTEELCLCFFEADSADTIAAVARLAGLPLDGAPEAVELLEVG